MLISLLTNGKYKIINNDNKIPKKTKYLLIDSSNEYKSRTFSMIEYEKYLSMNKRIKTKASFECVMNSDDETPIDEDESEYLNYDIVAKNTISIFNIFPFIIHLYRTNDYLHKTNLSGLIQLIPKYFSIKDGVNEYSWTEDNICEDTSLSCFNNAGIRTDMMKVMKDMDFLIFHNNKYQFIDITDGEGIPLNFDFIAIRFESTEELYLLSFTEYTILSNLKMSIDLDVITNYNDCYNSISTSITANNINSLLYNIHFMSTIIRLLNEVIKSDIYVNISLEYIDGRKLLTNDRDVVFYHNKPNKKLIEILDEMLGAFIKKK